MISMISALFGFLAPFVPKVFELFQSSQDHKQELEMMKLRLENANAEHTWRMEEINAKADVDEAIAIRKPEETYGDKLISSVAATDLPRWIKGYVALIGVHVDFFIRMCRPVITYGLVGFYMFYKIATFQLLAASGLSGVEAIVRSWTDFDEAMLVAVISFWFGNRTLNRWKK